MAGVLGPTPVGVLRTRWNGDADFAGAYSYLRSGGSAADRARLGRELAPGLWMAGEHTSVEFPGTMHGAWRSGLAAAAAVLASERSGLVVVVGAGLSGLACAGALRDAGVDVLVLEAQDRPGGRVRVDWSLGGPVHLGAAWLHGTVGHPFAAAAGSVSGWERAPVVVDCVSGPVLLSACQVGELLAGLESGLAARAAALRLDVPLAQVAASVVDSVAGSDDVVRAAAWYLLRFQYEYMYAAPLGLVSAVSRAEPYHLPGSDVVAAVPLDGFVARMADGLDVRYRWRVAGMEPVDSGWVLYSEDGLSVRAASAVVTVPVSSLHRRRLLPALDPGAQQALDRVDAGPVTKVFLSFGHRWWADMRHAHVVSGGACAVGNWVDVSELAGVPVLCGFAFGRSAVPVETMPVSSVLRLARRELGLLFRASG